MTAQQSNQYSYKERVHNLHKYLNPVQVERPDLPKFSMEPIIRSNILEPVRSELGDQVIDDKPLEKISENNFYQSSAGISEEPAQQISKSDQTYNLLHS